MPDQEYFLGTSDEELDRLGLQHRVWRPVVLDCWRRAGITVGSRVLDVGGGPGFATLDLAEIVGPTGSVVSVERSAKFVATARSACRARGFGHVQVHELDLMTESLPAASCDAAWCRWVACFVDSPPRLVSKIAASLRMGGVAIFHEYHDYASWKLLPPQPMVQKFVTRVMSEWRATGGEPDIAPALVGILAEHGLRVREATPRVFCVNPSDFIWRWPAVFIDVHLRLMVEQGRVDAAWAEGVRSEFNVAESDPSSLLVTPMVMEIIAERIT